MYLILERWEGREKRGEKHQCVVASCVPPTGNLAQNQACALTRNGTSNPLVHRSALNPLSHTIQGSSFFFFLITKLDPIISTALQLAFYS